MAQTPKAGYQAARACWRLLRTQHHGRALTDQEQAELDASLAHLHRLDGDEVMRLVVETKKQGLLG